MVASSSIHYLFLDAPAMPARVRREVTFQATGLAPLFFAARSAFSLIFESLAVRFKSLLRRRRVWTIRE
jgi:hypothetical protein